MIYFSEIKGKKVFTEDQILVGTLEDFIFLASETPNITKIVLRSLDRQKHIVPIQYLKKINASVIIKKDYETVELSENELSLVKNILDKQIIDISDNKIVRVNDVTIQDKDGFYLAGVDIGILGILRWFKLERFYNELINTFHLKGSSQFLSWADIHPVELAYGKVKLKKEEKRLTKLRPEDLADHLGKTNIVNVRKVIRILDEKFGADVIRNLNINYQTALFKQFSPERAMKVISFLDPDEAVDILLTLSEKKRELIMSLLSNEKRKEIISLLRLSRTPMGELMTSEFLTVSPNDTTSTVISRIKSETADFSFLTAVYVLNDSKELIGVFSLHDLLLQDAGTPVYKFMVQNLIIIHLSTPIEIAISKIFKYRLASLPVIDDNKHLFGIVTIDDLVEIILKKMR